MANAGLWTNPIQHILSDSGLSDEELMKLLEVGKAELERWKAGEEPHHLMKRGIVQVLGPARTSKAANSKTWLVTYPNGNTEIITNLTAWCASIGLPKSAASSFITKGKYGKYFTYYAERLPTEDNT